MIDGVLLDDIFKSSAHTLVCPVNTVGVMGKGLAKAFSLRYEGLEARYRYACRKGLLTVNRPWIHHRNDDEAILCFATKQHWRYPSRLEWIESGLDYLSKHYKEMGIKSLAIPMLGCGEGALDWYDVYPLVYRYMDPIDIPVITAEPIEEREEKK